MPAAKVADVIEAATTHPESEKQPEALPRPEAVNRTEEIALTTGKDKTQTFSSDRNFTTAFKRRRRKIISGLCAFLVFSILSMSVYRFSKSENAVEHFRQMRLNRLTSIGNVGDFARRRARRFLLYKK
ncbi:MAG: hypothetical protein LH614_07920 [Pyrinomonadaceae bacterium]|nr:hypothetical protein [Pyrinomonadaceae bacterium]